MAVYDVLVSMIDDEGRATRRTFLADVADEAALLTAAAAFITLLEAVTNLGITGYSYRREVAYTSAAAAGSNIDPGFTIKWNSALPIAPTTQIPDPPDGIKDGQGGIDQADGNVASFLAAFTAGAWRVNKNNPTQPTSAAKITLDK